MRSLQRRLEVIRPKPILRLFPGNERRQYLRRATVLKPYTIKLTFLKSDPTPHRHHTPSHGNITEFRETCFQHDLISTVSETKQAAGVQLHSFSSRETPSIHQQRGMAAAQRFCLFLHDRTRQPGTLWICVRQTDDGGRPNSNLFSPDQNLSNKTMQMAAPRKATTPHTDQKALRLMMMRQFGLRHIVIADERWSGMKITMICSGSSAIIVSDAPVTF